MPAASPGRQNPLLSPAQSAGDRQSQASGGEKGHLQSLVRQGARTDLGLLRTGLM